MLFQNRCADTLKEAWEQVGARRDVADLAIKKLAGRKIEGYGARHTATKAHSPPTNENGR
jgi:hypothetical protein